MCYRYLKIFLKLIVLTLIIESGTFLVSDQNQLMGVDLSSSIDKYLNENKVSDETEASDTNKNLNQVDAKGVKKNSKNKEDISWRIDEAYTYTDRVVKVIVNLGASKNFSVFKEDLKFYLDSGTEPIKVVYPKSFKRLDPIKRVKRESFKNDDKFEIYFIPMYESKQMMIKYSACTIGKCLFPTVQAIDLKCIEENFGSGIDINSIKEDKHYIQKVEKDSNFTEQRSTKLNLTQGLASNLDFEGVSLWIFILLFLAGILTNCTPCVAPMIPITVGIMVKNRKKLTSCFYALGICITYTLLGVVSVLGGKMFGFLMYSTPMNLIFAIFMMLVAISMLHDGSLVFVQNIFGRSLGGVAKLKNEYLSTFIKGVLAGGLAAPCTGPVLAALLAYIATSQNIYYGTSLMFVYSLGFALPYLLLGMFSGSLTRIKVAVKFQRTIKIIFASLMFALGFYYLRNISYRTFEQIWVVMSVLGVVVALLFLYINFKKPKTLFLSIASLGLGCFLFFSYIGINVVFKFNLDWVFSEEEAVMLSIKEEKPILLDNWANWCAHCHLAEKYLSSNQDKISSFVLWKKDLSKDDEHSQEHVEKYDLKSLPVFILLYPKEGRKIDQSLYDQGRIRVENMDMKYFNDIHDLLKELENKDKE